MPNGGARPGAGRKPKQKRAVKKVIAEAILSEVNELQMWKDLLTATFVSEDGQHCHPDNNIRFKALSYLTNRRDGMPPQSVQHSGEGLRIIVEHIGTSSHSASA